MAKKHKNISKSRKLINIIGVVLLCAVILFAAFYLIDKYFPKNSLLKSPNINPKKTAGLASQTPENTLKIETPSPTYTLTPTDTTINEVTDGIENSQSVEAIVQNFINSRLEINDTEKSLKIKFGDKYIEYKGVEFDLADVIVEDRIYTTDFVSFDTSNFKYFYSILDYKDNTLEKIFSSDVSFEGYYILNSENEKYYYLTSEGVCVGRVFTLPLKVKIMGKQNLFI